LSISVELFHSTRSKVVLATYFGRLFSAWATGSFSSVTCGQYPAKISYVFRPSRKASAVANHSTMASPMSSSM
jgi:hypothetical protein